MLADTPVSVSVAALAIAIISLLISISRELRLRPELDLAFDGDRDVRTQYGTKYKTPLAHSRWLRACVSNRAGSAAAKGCRGYLIGVRSKDVDGRYDPVLYDDVRPLRWMHDEPSDLAHARDLLPGINHWLDVAAAMPDPKGDPYTSDRVVLELQCEPPYYLGPGDYEFSVQVSAEATEPKLVRFRVTWDGTIDGLNGESSAI